MMMQICDEHLLQELPTNPPYPTQSDNSTLPLGVSMVVTSPITLSAPTDPMTFSLFATAPVTVPGVGIINGVAVLNWDGSKWTLISLK